MHKLEELKKSLEGGHLSQELLVSAVKQCPACAVDLLERSREKIIEINRFNYKRYRDLIEILNRGGREKEVEQYFTLKEQERYSPDKINGEIIPQ